MLEAQARGHGDGGEVAEHAVRLSLDALGELHRRRVEADLAREVDRVAGAHRLRIRADRLGRLARLDRGLHAGYLSLMISSLEKLIGTPRDGALLRYSLGLEYAKAGEHARAAQYLRDAVQRDPQYSAAWKALGRSLQESGEEPGPILLVGHQPFMGHMVMILTGRDHSFAPGQMVRLEGARPGPGSMRVTKSLAPRS